MVVNLAVGLLFTLSGGFSPLVLPKNGIKTRFCYGVLLQRY
jgi:hypothetical protein